MDNWRPAHEVRTPGTYRVRLDGDERVLYMKFANGKWHSYGRERDSAAKATTLTKETYFQWLDESKEPEPFQHGPGIYKRDNLYYYFDGTNVCGCWGDIGQARDRARGNTKVNIGKKPRDYVGQKFEFIGTGTQSSVPTPTVPGIYRGVWDGRPNYYAHWNGLAWSHKCSDIDGPFPHDGAPHQNFTDWMLVRATGARAKDLEPKPEPKPEFVRPQGMYKWGSWYGWWTGTELMSCQNSPEMAYEQLEANNKEGNKAFARCFWTGAELTNWKPSPKPKPAKWFETGWSKLGETPKAPGVYHISPKRAEEHVAAFPWHSYWDGTKWHTASGSGSPEHAWQNRHRDWMDGPPSEIRFEYASRWNHPDEEKPDPWSGWSEPGARPRSSGVYEVAVHRRHERPHGWYSYWTGSTWTPAYHDRAGAWARRGVCWHENDGPMEDVRFKLYSRWIPEEPSATPIKEVAVSKAAAARRKAPAQRRILLIT